MQFFATSSLLLALASLSSALAAPSEFLVERQSSSAPSPLTPSVVSEGSPLLIQWTPTSNASWKSMEIKFMTGANQNMVELYTIASGVDGTTSGAGKLNWTAPTVSPNAAIYFLQFTHSEQDPTWTTRFAIANSNGAVTSAPYATQPEGTAIPWGIGKIISAAASVSSSSSASSSSSSTSRSASASSSSSASTTSSSASSSTTSPSGSSGSSSSTSTKQGSSAGTLQISSAALLGSVMAVAGALML